MKSEAYEGVGAPERIAQSVVNQRLMLETDNRRPHYQSMRYGMSWKPARDPRGVALWMLVILALALGIAGVILYLDVAVGVL